MAVPKRRTSITRRKRPYALETFSAWYGGMPNCGEMSHRVCKECGSYKGEEVTAN